jgi:hypothetical protein
MAKFKMKHFHYKCISINKGNPISNAMELVKNLKYQCKISIKFPTHCIKRFDEILTFDFH